MSPSAIQVEAEDKESLIKRNPHADFAAVDTLHLLKSLDTKQNSQSLLQTWFWRLIFIMENLRHDIYRSSLTLSHGNAELQTYDLIHCPSPNCSSQYDFKRRKHEESSSI